MIKQIQLRGISRTPSDRMSEDGGCAESLNVQVDIREIAPMLKPDDITTDWYTGATTGLTGQMLFIHKGRGYENLIYINSTQGNVVAVKKGTSTEIYLYALSSGETVQDVKAIGNTLVLSTTKGLSYHIYKDGTYANFGDVPVPAIEFQSRQAAPSASLSGSQSEVLIEKVKRWTDADDPTYYSPGEGSDGYIRNGIYAMNGAVWTNYLNGDAQAKEDYEASYEHLKTILYDTIQVQITTLKQNGYFGSPVFARYALRLFDGSYIYQSVPVLLGAGTDKFFSASVEERLQGSAGEGNWKAYLKTTIAAPYTAKAVLSNASAFSGWGDIIDSIDLFLSTDIHFPLLYTDITSKTAGTATSSTEPFTLGFTTSGDNEKARTEILSKSVFYKVASIPATDLSDLTSGYDLLSNNNFASQDYLVTQPTLPDGYLAFNKKNPDSLFVYNNRLIMSGIRQEETSGYMYLNGQTTYTNTTQYKYEFKFYIRGLAETVSVCGRYADGTYSFVPFTVAHNPSAYQAKSYAWLAFPDARCYRVDVKMTDSSNNVTYGFYNMTEHPNLNCSYIFIGLATQLGTGMNALSSSDWDQTEQKQYTENDVIWAATMDNPFSWPVGGRVSFHSEIVALANATKALSEGQFGQYPLYVFTKDGIWSVPVSDEGNFIGSVPMSRDVALSKDSVVNLEQAVMFVSAQGVMLLQGSSVAKISQYMEGEHYAVPTAIANLFASTGTYAPLAASFTDTTPFQSYIATCKAAYDYTNQRVILFRSDKDYQYVYNFTTQTWHKMSLAGSNVRLDHALNSYPDCYICAIDKTTSKHTIWDMSVEYSGSNSQNVLPGLIVTRPFDLGEADVRKAIRSLRVRGKMNKTDVQYILMGSFDGLSWERLTSLRGGSFKLFRLLLICGLSPTERISWIDVDYVPRFATKLR